MRGDDVGVGLAVEGTALVGIGIVVVLGDGDDAAGAAQDMSRRAMSAAAPQVTRELGLSSVGVF
jgi:hypothetical protein